MDTALGTVNSVSKSFDSFDNFTNNPEYSLDSTATTVTFWIDLVESLRIGNTTDSKATTDDSAWVALAT